jgi:hypothetical protein
LLKKVEAQDNSGKQLFQVYAEEAASEEEDDDDGDVDVDDYDKDYSLEDKTPTRLAHGKKQHLDKISEERRKHSHEKQGHIADLIPRPAGMNSTVPTVLN